MERQHILDIGIGEGGKYITTDRTSVIRLGFDKDKRAIKCSQKNFGIEAVIGDAEVTRDRGLPFVDNAFGQIDILFPHEELLYALAVRGHPLWEELHRILVDQGKINVVVDSPAGCFQIITYRGEQLEIPDPEINIFLRAQESGFEVKSRLLNDEDLLVLGSDYSTWFVNVLGGNKGGFEFYQITAIKNGRLAS